MDPEAEGIQGLWVKEVLFSLLRLKKENGNGRQLRQVHLVKRNGKSHVVRSNYDLGANISKCSGLFGIIE